MTSKIIEISRYIDYLLEAQPELSLKEMVEKAVEIAKE
jgi:hypothetical protein